MSDRQPPKPGDNARIMGSALKQYAQKQASEGKFGLALFFRGVGALTTELGDGVDDLVDLKQRERQAKKEAREQRR